ncbi:hypothetical protein ACIO3O_01190 [Streptomyces sp. NPDC087440]|uniref:hypothetical protein n=1 Tax=Streptomyces sp. NPDC087440 TaxID=3365790 RepID=UPI00382FF5FA
MTSTPLPPVAPEVTATLVENLSPRLRKRLDAAVTKLAARPIHRDGDTFTIAVDDDTELRLYAPGGAVTTVDALTCGCLLAPACVHRAAAACAAPVADQPPPPADDPAPAPHDPAPAAQPTGMSFAPDPAPDPALAPQPVPGTATPPAAASAPDPTRTPRQPDRTPGLAPEPGPDSASGCVPAPAPDPAARPTRAHGTPDPASGFAPEPVPDAATGLAADPAPDPAAKPTRTHREPDPASGPAREPAFGPATAPAPGLAARSTRTTSEPHPATGPAAEPAPTSTATEAERAAADALWAAAAAVLESGVDGAGAVTQSALLRVAHTARLRQLPRAAAAALSVVTLLRAARTGDPAYRTADLVTALAQLLETAHRVRTAAGPDLAAARGQARRPYSPDGSLRLYGLFTEPVITDSGHGGVRTWVAGTDGRLFTVGDVAPGGAGRALGVADRAVRLGDTALTHRELGRAGLAVSAATVSPDGRLGAGKGVKAVAARGTTWTQPPLAALWETPPSEQAARALRFTSASAHPDTTTSSSDLLFLDVELLGPVRESGGTCLLAQCAAGPTVRLTVASDEPALAHRDNLNLLAAAPGTRLRIIGRLAPAPHPRLTLLACSHPTGDGTIDLGLDRLGRADLPAPATPVHAAPPQPSPSGGTPYLLERRVEQAVLAGRAALGMLDAAATRTDAARIRRAGLPTAAGLLTALCASAAPRERDHFGRLLPADTDGFTIQWLTAARYTAAVAESLCATSWHPTPEDVATTVSPPPPSTPHTAPR